MEETVRAFNYLIDRMFAPFSLNTRWPDTDHSPTDGLAFYWGTSEWTASDIQQATEIARRLNMVGPVCEQPHYSMLTRERFESEYELLWKYENYGS